ncbi:MAG: MFS transporter [Bacillota bacterium]|nr:MFS transporter [Bacillota bacterium]
MKNTLTIRNKEISTDFVLFLIISGLLGVVTATVDTSLANCLYEDLDFTVMERSVVEAPRELPGMLTVFLIGLLNSLGDIRIAAVANIIGGVGLILFGVSADSFALVLLFLVIYSTGQHLYLPLASSIPMSFATKENFGKRIGQVQGLSSFSIVVGSAALYLLYAFTNISYGTVFFAAGFFMIVSGFLFLAFRREGKVVSVHRLVIKKEFKLYYVLATINGARKQITLTFAPWLIIDVFHQPVTTITLLYFIVCILGIFFKPWFGWLIDKKGERFALQLEAVVMFTACLGFAFAGTLLPFRAALIVVGVCYVMDKLMEAAFMARATYVRRLASDEADVARTISMGQSMDHVVSMLIPLAAGWLWYNGGAAGGYVYVFIGGLAVSLLNFFVASKI